MGGHGHGDFNQTLLSISQCRHPLAAIITKPDTVKKGMRGLHHLLLLHNGFEEMKVVPAPGLNREQNVFQGTKTGDQRIDLIGPAHASTGTLGHRPSRHLLATQINTTRVARHCTRDLIDERGFTRPIGTNQRVNFALRNGQVHVVSHTQATVMLDQ